MGSPGGYAPRLMVYPPEKGSFPLDHFGECQIHTDAYKQCLYDNDNMSAVCHHLAKNYLQCRMDKGLMAQENLDNLGFKKPPVPAARIDPDDDGRSTEGYTLAGIATLQSMRKLGK